MCSLTPAHFSFLPLSFLFFWLPGMEMLIFNLGSQAGGRWFDTSSSGSKSTSMVGSRACRTRASRRQDYIITIPLGGCDLRHQHPPPAPSSPTSPAPIRRFFKYAISSPPLPIPCYPKTSFTNRDAEQLHGSILVSLRHR